MKIKTRLLAHRHERPWVSPRAWVENLAQTVAAVPLIILRKTEEEERPGGTRRMLSRRLLSVLIIRDN